MSTLFERYTKLRERVRWHLDYQKRLRERNQTLKQENRLLKSRLAQEKSLRRQLQEAYDGARAEVVTDLVTGLKNRIGLKLHYEWVSSTALRFFGYQPSDAEIFGPNQDLLALHFGALPMTLVMIDLNKFKKVNDTYGHMAGDGVLCAFAEIMHKTFQRRTHDYPARVGGDEFAILLPMTSPEKAEMLMRRFMKIFETSSVEAIKMFREQGGGFSYGIAPIAYYAPGDPFKDAWEAADQNMYDMKSLSGSSREAA